MKNLIYLMIIILFLQACQSKKKDILKKSSFKIGVISDCQYCDCDIKWNRYYKKSQNRLDYAVQTLNKEDLLYTIHLGDFIDRDFNSFDSLIPIWKKLNSKKYHVLGNHDFEVKDSLKDKIFKKLNLKQRYYSFTENNWRFIVLDGNDLSTYGALNTIKKQQTDSLFNLLKKDSLPFVQNWNGAVSNTQLNWIASELDSATKNDENVAFYCHFPLYPISVHNIWNREQVLALINKYSCVKLYFNGHNHDGAYLKEKGIHYLTFRGMVDTKDSTSFATVEFKKDTIIVNGYGREISRKLLID